MSLNDFELGKNLGKGAFASVILVTRKADRKIYAMKRINIAKMDKSEREAALNEIRILASLSHPNIIGYKEAFFDEMSRTLNIVMEYADDGDIDKKIKDNLKKRNLFSEETIWNWVIQILEGLKYLYNVKLLWEINLYLFSLSEKKQIIMNLIIYIEISFYFIETAFI